MGYEAREGWWLVCNGFDGPNIVPVLEDQPAYPGVVCQWRWGLRGVDHDGVRRSSWLLFDTEPGLGEFRRENFSEEHRPLQSL